MRSPVPRSPATRQFVDELLVGLARDRYSAAAWIQLLARSLDKSRADASRHPRAARQLHLLHGLFALHGRSSLWLATSWFLTWSHLGLLPEDEDRLGLANVLSVGRANLALVGSQGQAWVPAVAAVSDWLDGMLSRQQQSITAFGSFADPLADAVFWTWFTFRHDPSHLVRLFAVLLWVAPPAALAVAYFARARVIDAPRPEWSRYLSASLQALITTRAIVRWYRRLGSRVAIVSPPPKSCHDGSGGRVIILVNS